MMGMMVMMVYANYEHLLSDECMVVTDELIFKTYKSIVSLHLAKKSGCLNPRIKVNGKTVPNDNINFNSDTSSWTKGYLKLDGDNSVLSTDEPNQTEKKSISKVELTCVHYYRDCPQAKPNYVLNKGNIVMIPRLGQDDEELLVFVPKGGDFTLTTVDGNSNNNKFKCKADTENYCQLNSDSSTWVKIGLHFSDNNVEVQVNDMDPNTRNGNQVEFTNNSEEDLYIIQCNGTCGNDGKSTTTTTTNGTTTSVSTTTTTTTTNNIEQDKMEVLDCNQQMLIPYVMLGVLSVLCLVLGLALYKCGAGRKKERGQVSTESDTHKATAMTSHPGHNNSQPGISHHNNLVHDEANDLYEPLDGVGLNSKKPNMGMSSSTVFTEVNDVYESFDHQKMKPTRPAAPTATSYDEVNDVYESFDHHKTKPTRPAAPTATSYDEVNDVYESFNQTKHSAF
ncbi:hypothetical protein Pmani_029384 [Petrolisthes manimaculis]|uniref:Uncharacterized protein n=1 Tax=Petrolisthes manimaculis TaxID=1843537 RepID=A0AAE1TUJ2_9EUCA|nr:hypothetical protein Pmani_029384 [Petrolisthes manimaculis]